MVEMTDHCFRTSVYLRCKMYLRLYKNTHFTRLRILVKVRFWSSSTEVTSFTDTIILRYSCEHHILYSNKNETRTTNEQQRILYNKHLDAVHTKMLNSTKYETQLVFCLKYTCIENLNVDISSNCPDRSLKVNIAKYNISK